MKRIARKSNPLKPILIIGLFAIIVVATALVFKLTLGNLNPPKTGTLIYADGLNQAEKSMISEIVPEDKRFSEDLVINAANSATRPSSGVLYDILVPVTDFYSEKTDISSEELLALSSSENSSSETGDVKLISLDQLTPSDKLLSVDGKYFPDEFDSGALFRSIFMNVADGPDDENSRQEMGDIMSQISEQAPTFPTKDDILSINQTGVTALARAMQTKLNQVGDAGYFADKIADFLSSTDLTHISNEVSFADNCTTSSGSVTLCADPRMIKAIEMIGTDIVELTGNHNNDWSTSANLKTLELYADKGYQTFGGGKDEETAKIPLKISDKNTNITWIGVNQSTSTKANGQGASGSHPGANIYDEATVKNQIAEAKANGDFVIVDVQFFECYSYPEKGTEMPSCDAPISGQQAFFRHLIDLGADMVVGTQAHQPQTYEIYNGKPIYYGLGNLFFDQTYWPGTTRGIILTHYFKDGKLLQTRLSPTIYDRAFQVQLMDKANAEQFLGRLLKSSPKGN